MAGSDYQPETTACPRRMASAKVPPIAIPPLPTAPSAQRLGQDRRSLGRLTRHCEFPPEWIRHLTNFHGGCIETKKTGKVNFERRRIPASSLLITNVFSEVAMNANFNRPVYLKEREGLIREILSLADAIDFLENWPENARDFVHEATIKTCYMAHAWT